MTSFTIVAEIANEVLASLIQQYIKRYTYHDQMVSISGK